MADLLASAAMTTAAAPTVVPACPQLPSLPRQAWLPAEPRRPTVNRVLRRYGPSYLKKRACCTSDEQRRVLRQLLACRQPELGAHGWHCDWCGHTHLACNGCGNRHCTQCGAVRRSAWLEKAMSWRLPTSYLHLVITVPHELTALMLANGRALYGLFFQAVREALITITRQAYDAQPGMILLLHTWSQTMLAHLHIHVVLTAGGLSTDGTRWIEMHADDEAFSKPRLGGAFRERYVKGLIRLVRRQELCFPDEMPRMELEEDFQQWLAPIATRPWHTFSQAPPVDCPSGSGVLKYLARYVVGSAITDQRILSDDGTHVVIRLKDYYTGQEKTLRMTGEEFVRRFLLHVLPSRMHRVHYAGLYSFRRREEQLATCRQLLEATDREVSTEFTEEEEPFPNDVAALLKEPASGPSCPRCAMPNMRSLGRHTAQELAALLDRLHALWAPVVTVVLILPYLACSARHQRRQREDDGQWWVGTITTIDTDLVLLDNNTPLPDT